MKKLIAIGVLALAVAVVAPIQAKPPTSKPSHPSTSNKCQAHGVAYVASGTLTGGSLTKNSDGTYSGTLTVQVKDVNHHAKPGKGTSQTYTLTSAKVNLHGENPASLTANSRIVLLGKIATVPAKCGTTTPTITISSAVIKAPKPTH